MKTLWTALFLLTVLPGVKAQDTIRTMRGKNFPATIKKVSPYEVTYLKYMPASNRHAAGSGSIYRRLSTSEVAEIIYANGRRGSTFPVLKRIGDMGNGYFTQQDFYVLGENDARLYFRRYKGASTGTFLATFPESPLIGLCVAAATSTTKPSPRLFTYPNTDLLGNEDYRLGYARKAHDIKAAKVWTNWGIGCVLTLVTYMPVSSIKR